MRTKDEIKAGLFKALDSVIKKTFYKKNFNDSFTVHGLIDLPLMFATRYFFCIYKSTNLALTNSLTLCRARMANLFYPFIEGMSRQVCVIIFVRISTRTLMNCISFGNARSGYYLGCVRMLVQKADRRKKSIAR